MSTGERINKASDDAARLAISEKMKAGIRSTHMAGRNAVDGISLVQVAEGALHESSSMLVRMRELAIQASSDTISSKERQLANYEYQQLKSEIDRISKVTEFNGHKLLDGVNKSLHIQVGNHGVDSSNRIGFDLNGLKSGAEALGVSSDSVISKDAARRSIENLDSALEKLVGRRTMLGALQTRLTSTSNNLSIYDENLNATNSRIRDTDYAQAASQLASTNIISNASTAVNAHTQKFGQEVVNLL